MTDQIKKSVFEALADIMRPVGQKMHITEDGETSLQVTSNKKDKKGRSIWFGGVQVKKNYVSYHLMPVYVFPDLLSDISNDLERRMQGKSCFNFKKTDEQLFEELRSLTVIGYERFEEMTGSPY